MSSRTKIYWPQAWTGVVARARAALVVFVVLVVVLVAGGVLLLQGGGQLAGMLTLALVGWLVPLGFLGWIVLRAPHRGWSATRAIRLWSEQAVVLPHSAASKCLFLAFAAVSVVVFVAMPTLAAATPLDGSAASARFHAWAPWLPVFAIFPLAGLLSRLIRKRGQLGVGISPNGVYHWSWFGCCFYAWDWIREVRPAQHKRSLAIELVVAEPEHSWDPEENLVARIGAFRSRMQRIQLAHLAVNPAVPLYAIEFYRRHPELRQELGTERGVERIRSGDLPDVMQEVYNNGRFKPQ